MSDEARSLAIARQATRETTFLGAHVVPPEYALDPEGVDLVTGPMLDACAPYARWVDVFCETGAFDADQARTILRAGEARGLAGRLHANQLGPGPGVGSPASSASPRWTTAPTSPTRTWTRSRAAARSPRCCRAWSSPPARRTPTASGCSTPAAAGPRQRLQPRVDFTSSMPLCIALAVREMRMTPAEALHAATRGGAAALRRDDVGHLEDGAAADLVVLDAPSYLHLAYRPGVPLVHQVFVGGAATL